MSEYQYLSAPGNTTSVSYGRTLDEVDHIAISMALDQQEWRRLMPLRSASQFDEFTLLEDTDYEDPRCSLISLSGNIDHMQLHAKTEYAYRAIIVMAAALKSVRRYDTIKYRLAATVLRPHGDFPVYPNGQLFEGKFRKFITYADAVRDLEERKAQRQTISSMASDIDKET